MSMMEKVLIQIFERKNRIIDHVKEQILGFDHHLASKCLIDGFVPPSWLLLNSPSELNKEDFISELLFPYQQPSIPYCSQYEQPVITADNVRLPDVSCTRFDAFNESLDQYFSSKADELDPSVKSPPEDCRDRMITDICPDPGLSLARIHRSKSRQRALEHRNSAKSCKNIESSEKNGDASDGRNKGSKIAFLWSDLVDKSEFIGSNDDVVSDAVEKEEREQCWSKERSETVYTGGITRSRSSVQLSESVSRVLGADNTSCIAKQDSVVCAESISKSKRQPDFVSELLGSMFVDPVHNTLSCQVTNDKRGQFRSKERGEDIYTTGITRSRSSVQPPKPVNCPPSAGNRFCVTNKDGIVLAESINKSRLQPEAAGELLQFVQPVDNAVTCVAEKNGRGQCMSKKRSETMTRSRSCVHSPKSVNGLSCSGKTSDVENKDGFLKEFISESEEQPNVVDELLKSAKPAILSDESCGSRKARDLQSMEKENNVYQGRITRSRSSSQHNHVDKLLKLDSCPDRSINDGICKPVQLACPCDITNESCGIKAKTSDHIKENTVVDQYNNGSITLRANLSENLLNVAGSSTLEYEVTQAKSAASNKSPYAKLSDRSEEAELKEVSGTRVNSLPCADGSELADLNQCDAIVADTYADSDNSVESHSASSASNLDGANNPPLVKSPNRHERIELEVVVKSLHSQCAMMVMPKQPYFNNLGECNSNEALSLASVSEEEVKSLENRPPKPLRSLDKLDEVPSLHYQQKYNLSLEKQMPEEQEGFSREKKQSETDLKRTSGPVRTSNCVVFSVKEALEASADAATSNLPESKKISEQKIFLDDHLSDLKVANEDFRRNSPKGASWSNLYADSGMDHIFQKEHGKLEVVESLRSPTVANNCDTFVHSPAILSENNLTGVCSPALLRKADIISGNAIEHPSAALSEETKGHSVKQKMESSSSRSHNADSVGRSIDDSIDTVLAPTHASSECKIAIPTTQQGRHSGFHVVGWPNKRRKINGQQSNSLSLSLSPKEENVTHLNTDKCQVVEEDLTKGKLRSKESSKNQNAYSTFMRKQFDGASVLSLPLETLEDCEDHSVEGTIALDPSGISFNSTRQCTADGNQILLNIHEKSEFGNTEHLICDKRCMQESKLELREDGENLSHPISSPCQPPMDLICADQTSPELEGFILQTDSEQICIGGDAVGFDKLELPKSTIERASLLEQLCKSACIHTPLSQFPTTYRLHWTTDLHQSIPNGLLECLDLRSTLPNNDDGRSQFKVSHSSFGEDIKHAFLGGSFSDCLPLSSSQVTGDVKKPYLSPVGKVWDRIRSNSGSSDERGSLNPELPCISEENENTDQVVDAFQEGSASEVVTCSIKRKPLAEISECPNASESVSIAEIFTVRDSLDSVSTAYSFTGTKNGVKQKIGKHNASKRVDSNKMKENLSIPPSANGSKRASESLHNRFSKPKLSGKTSLRKGGPSFSQKESKVNNIVSKVTSFIPLVQQKQAAAVITGKRDVKVKALEAAEAAKRLAEKKENDRKMKKEALKLERARLEQENLRQLELEKKRKEERKKKEADMAAKKRQREEEERLEKEMKRRRMEEARRQHHAPEEKLCSKKDDKEKKYQALDQKAQTMKVPNDEAAKHEKMLKETTARNEGKMLEIELRTAVASTSDIVNTSMTIEDCNAKVKSISNGATQNDNLTASKSVEQSYDISPYKGSDDEDEDEVDDDQPNSKFIPSWASKNCVALLVASQQKVDPEVIFPPKSFCTITEVLLPRKLQQNRAS